MKKTKGNFPKGISKVIPKTKEKTTKMKFMSDKQRIDLQRRIAHYEATKDLPTI